MEDRQNVINGRRPKFELRGASLASMHRGDPELTKDRVIRPLMRFERLQIGESTMSNTATICKPLLIIAGMMIWTLASMEILLHFQVNQRWCAAVSIVGSIVSIFAMAKGAKSQKKLSEPITITFVPAVVCLGMFVVFYWVLFSRLAAYQHLSL